MHVCVIRAEHFGQTVPELLGRLESARPTTFVSGPSATSDIKFERVERVDGPHTLVVALAGQACARTLLARLGLPEPRAGRHRRALYLTDKLDRDIASRLRSLETNERE